MKRGGGAAAGQASAGTAVAEPHYCSSTAPEKKPAAPATWPPCHACTPAPATHTKRPGGARRRRPSLALQSRVAAAGEQSREVVWVWNGARVGGQGSGIGWEGVEVKPGWRRGPLFLPLLSPD